jgi:radical SAM superfamily enzyme YgiQ (UPF0313 family)
MKIALLCFGNEESYGLLFVGGELLLHGQEIRFFDAENQRVEEQVSDWGADFAFFSPMTTFYQWALDVSRGIQKRRPTVVSAFGGHHASARPRIVEDAGVDVVVIGPARGAVEQILGGTRGVIRTVPTTPADLSMPAREQYYADIPRMGKRYRKILLSMLGCQWNCTFCSSASGARSEIFGREAQTRYYLDRHPIPVILEEAQLLLRYRTQEIEWVDDDIFAGHDVDAWVQEFSDAWVREIGLPMYVSTTSASVLRASDDTLRALRRIANCVGMGVQAIRPESLALFNRRWDSESRMKQAYDRLRSFGYSVNLQAIIGVPVPDPIEDALDTVKGMQRIGPGSICSCYPLVIYPNTAMERYVTELGLSLNAFCTGDTNPGIPHIAFPPETTKQLRNLCKLATMFVKYGIEENWMRALLNVDLDDRASRELSTVRYFECVRDRLKEKGDGVFQHILQTTNIRY